MSAWGIYGYTLSLCQYQKYTNTNYSTTVQECKNTKNRNTDIQHKKYRNTNYRYIEIQITKIQFTEIQKFTLQHYRNMGEFELCMLYSEMLSPPNFNAI